MSSFGIFYNRKIQKMDALPEPKNWPDLGDPISLFKLDLDAHFAQLHLHRIHYLPSDIEITSGTAT
jgi:hypothetical protein